ncbi:MAG TPA: ABC transporter permease subunit [Candidatus Limnocylindrales bacterium]|nr:ABC transporter permease subunit [Candidatus Limnocylindrales bacterium]
MLPAHSPGTNHNAVAPRALRVPQRGPLVRDTLRSHRVGVLAWIVGGGLAMLGTAAALAAEMEDFPGGPAGLAASVSAGAEAMRLLRWPAERLDTLGGYLTYHNVILFNLFLAIYGLVQGTRDIRGAEERGALEEVLATGHTRAAVVRDRAIGFALVAGLIGLGMGVGLAAGLAAGDEPDLAGALITMGTSGLVAFAGYALGMLLSQVVGSVRVAGGVGSVVLCALYVATNVEDDLGPLGFVRFVSPFHWANQSRALVPGQGLDLPATAVLVLLGVAMLALAAWAFTARDYAAPLWGRPGDGAAQGRSPARAADRIPHRMLSSVAAAGVRRGWVGMLVWAGCVAAFTALFAALQPQVMDYWNQFDFASALAGATGSTSAEDTYWSFAGEFFTPVIAAYVLTQASGWIADLTQGRVEMVLSAPVTWPMLVRGRLLATSIGVAVIIAGALTGLGIGAASVGSPLDPVAMARLVAVGLLFGAALAAVAAIVVALVRRPLAVTIMAVLVGASYLLAWLVPTLGWPQWLSKLSVFWAFGHPYLAWPSTAQWLILLALATVGSIAAGAIADRTPKVP